MDAVPCSQQRAVTILALHNQCQALHCNALLTSLADDYIFVLIMNVIFDLDPVLNEDNIVAVENCSL